jgi:hypothetical protein
MSTKEELTYRITDAINALTGDNESKIIIYWETEDKNSNNSFSSIFEVPTNNSANTNINGIAVVCKNGNETDREAIISVICSLFDISPENVGCVIG